LGIALDEAFDNVIVRKKLRAALGKTVPAGFNSGSAKGGLQQISKSPY
jgi:hypothetical protein